jgi:hypothetical protein
MRCFAPLAAVLMVAGLAVSGAGCGREKKPAANAVTMAGEAVATSRLVTIAAGVCDAAQLAGHNVDSARATFYGQSHEGLHLIARGLQDVDRNQSAALLEAKQKVEADFLAPPPGPQLVNDLRQLADVTRSSLARFKVSADACPPS